MCVKHTRKKKFVIRPHETTHRSITHPTTQQAEQQQFVDITTAVAGSTYYHAHVLHHHPQGVADSTMYMSNKLITTTYISSISLGDVLHKCTTCFRVLGLRREEPTTASTTYRTSRISYLAQQQQQQTVEVATNGS